MFCNNTVGSVAYCGSTEMQYTLLRLIGVQPTCNITASRGYCGLTKCSIPEFRAYCSSVKMQYNAAQIRSYGIWSNCVYKATRAQTF